MKQEYEEYQEMKEIKEMLEAEGRKETAEENNNSPLKQILLYSQMSGNKLEQICKELEEQSKRLNVVLNEVRTIQRTALPKQEKEVKRRKFFWKHADKKAEEKFFQKLVNENFTDDQLEEIQLGLDAGLSMQNIEAYAKKDIPGKSMKRIREIYLKMKGDMKDE